MLCAREDRILGTVFLADFSKKRPEKGGFFWAGVFSSQGEGVPIPVRPFRGGGFLTVQTTQQSINQCYLRRLISGSGLGLSCKGALTGNVPIPHHPDPDPHMLNQGIPESFVSESIPHAAVVSVLPLENDSLLLSSAPLAQVCAKAVVWSASPPPQNGPLISQQRAAGLVKWDPPTPRDLVTAGG